MNLCISRFQDLPFHIELSLARARSDGAWRSGRLFWTLGLGFVLCQGITQQASAQVVANGTTQSTSGVINTGVVTSTAGIGLRALNAGIINTTAPVLVTTGGSGATGVEATSAGSVTLLDGSTVTINGLAYGIYVSGAGSRVSATNTAITLNSAGTSQGVYATTGGLVTLNGGSVATRGNQASGLFAFSGGAVINATNVTVSTQGNSAYGAETNTNAQINLIGGSVSTAGSTAYGLYSIGAGPAMTVSGTVVRTSGADSVGAYGLTGALDLTDVSITTTGAGSDGAVIDNGALTFTGGSVSTAADNAYGMLALAVSTMTVSNVGVITSGVNSLGISSQLGAQTMVTGGEVNTSGAGAHGLFAVGGGALISATGLDVFTGGAAAYGAVVRGNATLALSNSTVTTSGAGSSALYSSAYAAGASAVTITDSTLSAALGAGITVAGHSTVGPSTTLNAIVRRSRVVSGNGAWLATTTNSGSGFFGIANIDAYASTLTGSAVTDPGSTANVALHDATLWNLTGTSNVTSLANDNSSIIFAAPLGDPTLASSFKTLTSGVYVGSSGAIMLNTHLAGDGAPSDQLVIDGGTATGTTQLFIRNAGGAGALTTGDGIRVVDAINGATTGANAFTLAGDFVTADGRRARVGGAYAYTLHHNGFVDATDSDWYLRSLFVDGPGEPEVPLLNPGDPLYETYPQLLMAMNSVPTLQQRLGNRFWSGAAADPAGTSPAAGRVSWGRIDIGHGSFMPAQSSSATTRQVDQFGLQAGTDFLLHETPAGDRLIGGLTLRYGQGAANVSSINGSGTINSTAIGLGGTLTWYGADGVYVDGQAQLSLFGSDLLSSTTGYAVALGSGGVGTVVSLETGKRIELGDGLSITPQAQLSYSGVSISPFDDVFGTPVSLDRASSLRGRLGIAVDKEASWTAEDGTASRSHLYGIANLYNEFLDGSQVDVAGSKFAQRDGRFWAGVGLGASLDLQDDKYTIFGSVNVETSLEDIGQSYAFAAKAGLRVRW